MTDVIDLSAKLLANEDIAVERANSKTASFDIKSRVLTIPMWQEMTPQIEQMLVGHEVGHALYTTDEYTVPMKENPNLRSYMNVLEDVRIEKFIKKKYPGIRKHMAAGYKELNDRDFFELDGQDVNSMLLIDRINLYFKTTAIIDFTPTEKQFVSRAQHTESIQDVIELANEVYEYSKEEYEKMMEEIEEDVELQESEMEDSDEESDPFELEMPYDMKEEEGEEVEEDEESDGSESYNEDIGDDEVDDTSNGTEQGDFDPLEAKTQRAFNKNLDDLADTDFEYRYFDMMETGEEIVVDYKTCIKEMTEELAEIDDTRGYPFVEFTDWKQFKADSLNEVNYLVKEFEMKKSAALYKRSQSAKSGMLDMKKIFGYKINDDLFKRVKIVPEGKNHGMVILVDWSGSMHDVISDTIKQVISLAMFCSRVKIPYRVYAFSSQYHRRDENGGIIHQNHRELYEKDVPPTIIPRNFHMLEMFSDKMTSSDFNKMAELLLDPRLVRYSYRYALGGTPLNEALVWCYQNLGKFIGKNNVEKMTFITLTDGDGSALEANCTMRESVLKEHGYYDREAEVIVPNSYTNYKNFYRDEVTKKTYRFYDDNNQHTRTMLNMIKDRYDVNMLGFYITNTGKRDLYWAIQCNMNSPSNNVYGVMDRMRKAFRKDGFYIHQGAGRDELYIIPKNKMKVGQSDLEADGEMTARKLASQFGKYLKNKKTSRVILNKFIGWVA